MIGHSKLSLTFGLGGHFQIVRSQILKHRITAAFGRRFANWRLEAIIEKRGWRSRGSIPFVSAIVRDVKAVRTIPSAGTTDRLRIKNGGRFTFRGRWHFMFESAF